MSLNLPTDSKIFLVRLSIALVMLATGCSQNYLSSFVTNPNDESLLYSASANIRNSDYTSAISDCASISASSLSTEQFATICASAYAGRCGFSMGFFTTNLSSIGTAPWSAFEVSKIGTTAVSAITDCDSAEAILRGIGGPTARSSDANFFMLTLSLFKLGVIAKALGDPTNTGAVPAGFNVCGISNTPINYPLMAAEAVWDLLKAAKQLQSDQLIGTVATAMQNQCTLLSTIGEDICAATDPTVLTVAQVNAGLSTLREGTAFGVNQAACGGGTVATSASCRCP
jgi:hypothetical protein